MCAAPGFDRLSPNGGEGFDRLSPNGGEGFDRLSPNGGEGFDRLSPNGAGGTNGRYGPISATHPALPGSLAQVPQNVR